MSTYRIAVAYPDGLGEQCERLLDRVDFDGVAMIELKEDATTGIPYLMEINGRLWGSLQLAVDAGVNFPDLLVRATLGEPCPGDAPSYAIPTGLRWEFGELDHLIACTKASGAATAPSDVSHSAWKALGGIVRHHRGDRLEVLRLRDARPFITEAAEWIKALR